MKILLSLFLLGLSFGSGPCLASCGPILIPYVAANKKNVLNSLRAYVLFSLGRIFVYLALGMLIFLLGRILTERLLSDISGYVLFVGGAFVVLIGLLTAFGRKIEYKPCQFLKKHLLQQDGKSIFTFGLIVGLLPCAPLLALFSYTGLISKNWFNSLLYSFVFGAGTFISPLLPLVLLTGYFSHFFKHNREVYERIFGVVCGLIIFFFGLQLLRKAF